MLAAVIFDMDGVLVDSEPIWQDVEVDVLGRLGVPLTRDRCKETMGFRVNEAVAHWYERYAWTGPTVDDVAEEIVGGVIAAIAERGELKEGALEAVDFLQHRGVRLAIASSSYYRVIEAVLDRGGLAGRFEVVHSAEDEANGKPDPAVYLTAASKLGVDPALCVAIEDSPNGVLSAKRAGMDCVAVPDPGTETDPVFAEADLVLPSLTELPQHWAALTAL
ncbi:MAG: mannitol-/sugar-/sorbitol-6-/2-deoxyglucose-6-phosphatase [Actinomycetota bacterium]|nr:mannitol-/sugar-/sorbitol-6-/2-deoxyglucose-6-phosphatase [Actinomycetota bacterium]